VSTVLHTSQLGAHAVLGDPNSDRNTPNKTWALNLNMKH